MFQQQNIFFLFVYLHAMWPLTEIRDTCKCVLMSKRFGCQKKVMLIPIWLLQNLFIILININSQWSTLFRWTAVLHCTTDTEQSVCQQRGIIINNNNNLLHLYSTFLGTQSALHRRGNRLNHHQCAASTWMMRRQPYCARTPTTHQLTGGEDRVMPVAGVRCHCVTQHRQSDTMMKPISVWG